jgi:GNAT superfamily N-acetyltransferase
MPTTLIEPVPPEYAEALTRLYQNEWWTRGRRAEDVRRMLSASDLSFGLLDEGRLVGFSRVLTDGVYKALILDVIVEHGLRGTGAGRQLMDAILGHERLAPVRHLELYCLPELTAFYERWGFTAELGELRLMRRAAVPPSG